MSIEAAGVNPTKRKSPISGSKNGNTLISFDGEARFTRLKTYTENQNKKKRLMSGGDRSLNNSSEECDFER